MDIKPITTPDKILIPSNCSGSWWCERCQTLHPQGMYCAPRIFIFDPKTKKVIESQESKLFYYH